MREKTQVNENTQYTIDYLAANKRSIANAVQVFFRDGTHSERVEIFFPIGHRRRRAEAVPLLRSKFQSNLATRFDSHLRAFDMENGSEIWKAPLPAEPQATPMSYEFNGEQFVVITAGGARRDGEGRGDYVVAFKRAKAAK